MRCFHCLLSGMGRVCLRKGCWNEATVSCTARGGPYCGNCCQCEAHRHRTHRAGPRRGRHNATQRRVRQTCDLNVSVVDEAAFYLLKQEPEWCRDHRLAGITAVSRVALSFAILRLGWDWLPHEDRGFAALTTTSFHDVLGPVRWGRLLDGVRAFVRRSEIERMAPALLAALRRRPHAREAAFMHLAETTAPASRQADAAGPLSQAAEVKGVRWRGLLIRVNVL